MAEDVFDDDEIVFAKDPEEFFELVNHYLKYPDERIPYIHRGFNKVVSEHTYFHRVAQILKELGLEEEQFKCMKIAADTMNQLIGQN
jgi:spore maturation protein CgeB